MSGLTQSDMKVLRHYAREGNRELYWNYLGHEPGNDGYGQLALGVVRNDNAPGQTANDFADAHAKADHVDLTERDWNTFGIELMQGDVAARQLQLRAGRPDLALNLPVRDVQEAHDKSFESRDIDPNAWTPRELLEAARRQGGQPEAEQVWTRMLDNSWHGITRFRTTLQDVATYQDGQIKSADYIERMGWARAGALIALSTNDPDRIGTEKHTFVREPKTGRWTLESPSDDQSIVSDRLPHVTPVRDADKIRELEDIRELRIERQQLRQQFHPDDPYRNQPVLASPKLVAATDAAPPMRDSALAASATDPSKPGHARHDLHQQCSSCVDALASTNGQPSDSDGRARLTASLTGLAAGNGLQRVDHVLVGPASADGREGPNVFVVQGQLRDPAHMRAHMPLDQAIGTPVDASHRALAQVDQQQAMQPQQSQQVIASQVDEPGRVIGRSV